MFYKIKILQTLVKVFAITILIISPFNIFSQSNNLCRVTIESVKCIKPSTGQDAYTAFLFKGIEIALKAGAAVASGGSSLTATAALEIGKEALKKTAKAGIQIAITNQAKNVFAANKDQILGLANAGGRNTSGEPSSFSKVAGVAEEIYQLTTLQGIFNKVYGESPDALYIKIDGAKIWPSGQSVSIKSQQQFAVNASAVFERSKGFSIQLMEYDYGSNDDDLGIQRFDIPPSFMGSDRVVDQVFYHKEEGSFYTVTFKVESLLKHRFINDIVGSLWDQTVNGGTTAIAFGGGNIVSRESGQTWEIVDADKINYCINGRPYMEVTFTSANTATGRYLQQNYNGGAASYTAKRRSLEHRFANNIIGSSWDYITTPGYAPTILQFGNGNIEFPSSPSSGVTWKFLAADFIAFYNKDMSKEMKIMFESENSFNGIGWDGKTKVSGKRRAGTTQQQQQQTNLQHRFINNIIGTSWNYSDPAAGNVSFSFGQGTLNNINPPGTFWDAVTWKIAGNDNIELRTSQGAIMNLSFSSPTSFGGYSWFNKSIIATGTIQQQQQYQQQQQTFQHRFINNLIGTSWYYTDANGNTFSFNFGNGIISNFSAPGTYWDRVTWAITGNDKIQLRSAEGNIMDLSFNDPYNFSGTFWNNGTDQIKGINTQAQTQQDQSLQHQFINNIVGTSWNYTESTGAAFTFSFGEGRIINFSSPGTFWDKVTWSIAGNDIIELRTETGATMTLSFSDEYNFSGYFWDNNSTVVTGIKRQ